MVTYFFVGSFLLRSNLSKIKLKDTRNIFPSSRSKAICEGPRATRLTPTFNWEKAAGDNTPNLFNFSDTSFNLKKQKRN